MRRIHIFKAGTQTSMAGATLAFSEADLAGAAAAYDPALHEAPCVVGHPVLDAPAYGWVKSLTADGANLYAEPDQVNPEFAELVSAGAFKKVSAAFYSPTAKNNPVPGTYYLRHVGFLGAMAPAVKGLKPIEFSERELADEVVQVELEFSEVEDALVWALDDTVRVLRSLRDSLIEREGTEAAEKVLSAWRLDAMAENVTRARAKLSQGATVAQAFAESPTTQESTTVSPEEAAALEQRAQTAEAALATAQAALRASAVAANTAAHAAFAETLVAEARIASADAAVVTALLDFAEPAVIEGEQAPATVEFGEGDAKQPIGNAIKAFLQGLPQRVGTGEQASRERAAANGGGQDGTVQYAEGTPQDQIDLDKRIRAYAAAHQLSYQAAASAVAAGAA